MVNKNKRKGSAWEHDLVELLNKKIPNSKIKRVPSSGAMGTALNEPLLTGDVIAEFSGFPRKFRIECKTGYGGATQLAVKKEWLDKILEEAKISYAIPMLAGKFSGARSGIKHFMVLDIDTFCDIINYINDLKKELDLIYEKK